MHIYKDELKNKYFSYRCKNRKNISFLILLNVFIKFGSFFKLFKSNIKFVISDSYIPNKYNISSAIILNDDLI